MSKTLEIKIPDIGDFQEVTVIEVLVKPGDRVQVEDSLITLESDKATMDVPSPSAGTVTEVKVKVGDKVAEGALVLTLEPSTDVTPMAKSAAATSAKATPAAAPEPGPRRAGMKATGAPPVPGQTEEPTAPPPVVLMPGPAEVIVAVVGGPRSHASPSVRRFARELGVDVSRVKGSGPKNRILKEDVQAYVKGVLAGARPAAAGGTRLAAVAEGGLHEVRRDRNAAAVAHQEDFRRQSGAQLGDDPARHAVRRGRHHRDLEKFRVALNKEKEKNGIKVTVLAFLIKAGVDALKKFPMFNSSLDGENLIVKHYYHIGFAADTPNGLVVPVIRDADKKIAAGDCARGR